MLEFNILKGQYLNRLDKNVVSADTTDLKAQFELTADFAGTITVWWRRSDVDNTYTSTLAADGTCTIPAEALAATDKAVYGPYDHDVFVSISDTGRTTTNEYKLTVLRSAFSTTATPGTGGSPTAYEELVEQFDELKADNQAFKDGMTEQQETFESTVTENVDNIRYIVETETAPPIIDEASGAEITLEDSAYRQVRDLQLYGYSKQTQTTGAQLIDLTSKGTTQNGVTFTIKEDGGIVANGTATSATALNMNVPSHPSSGQYYLSGCPSGGSNATYRVELRDASGAVLHADEGGGSAFTVSQEVSIADIRIASGYTCNNLVFYPMLNAGTSALPWEPYSGGYASPSPDWAQPIHSVADEVNLLESLTMNINAPSAEFPETSDTLYVMLCPESGTSQVNIHLRYNDGSYGQDVAVVGSAGSNGIEHFIFITPSKPCTGVSIYNVTSAAARTLSYGMVAISDTALPYRPYGHNVTVESQGANLIDLPKNLVSSYGGISVEGLGDGTFLYSGTATGKNVNVWLAGNYGVTTPIITLKKGEYGAPPSEASFYSNTDHLNTNNVITVPDGGMDITGIRAPSAAIGKYYNKIIYPMLNRGSTPLPWQPYVAPSSALITLTDSLRGIPVTSGGNYTDADGRQWIADYIYRRQTDGKWMLWRNCGRVEYIGGDDENWTYEGAYIRFLTSSKVSNALVADGRSMVICNRGLYHRNGIGSGCAFIAGGPRFYFSPDPSIESVDSFKTWLQSNPLEVVYQLAAPTIEELPENVQTELNGLYTYNLHTDMWNNDGAYMNLKYVADTKTWINNKIAGLSTAMIENL